MAIKQRSMAVLPVATLKMVLRALALQDSRLPAQRSVEMAKSWELMSVMTETLQMGMDAVLHVQLRLGLNALKETSMPLLCAMKCVEMGATMATTNVMTVMSLMVMVVQSTAPLSKVITVQEVAQQELILALALKLLTSPMHTLLRITLKSDWNLTNLCFC